MADTKISALTALTGSGVDPAADFLAIVDTSATATKKILIDELRRGLFRGARLTKSGTQSISNNTDTIVSWSSAVFDVGTWWSAGTPNVLTVPSGVNYVAVWAHGDWVTASTRRDVRIRKGTTVVAWYESPASNEAIAPVSIFPLDVTAGDTLDVQVWQSSGGAINFNSFGNARFGVVALG